MFPAKPVPILLLRVLSFSSPPSREIERKVVHAKDAKEKKSAKGAGGKVEFKLSIADVDPALEHFQVRWNLLTTRKMRQNNILERRF